jgi:UDP-3-O-[3-hydroxymyristoyl] glucosamine N-acyltransferase
VAIALPDRPSVGALVERYGGTCDDALKALRVGRVVTPGEAGAGDLVVLTKGQAVFRHLEGSVWICSPECAEQVPAPLRWRHAHAMWVVAHLLASAAEELLAWPTEAPPPLVARGATVASDVLIEPGAIVLSGARIGSGSRIGPGAVVHSRVALGERVIVGANSVIGRPGFGFVNGPNGEVVRIPHLGGVIVEDDVEIGALCTIDAGTLSPTRLGRMTKLDAHVHVGHNVSIGRRCFIAAQVGIAGSATIGDDVLIGGQAGVTDHATVGDRARIAAKSGVIGNVAPGVTVAGYPAVPRVRWLRAMAALMRRARR